MTTATPQGSVALLRGDSLLASCVYADEMRHAERLFDTVDQVLADACWPRRRVSAIACDVGPGSFTGVRVGVASAKGMALALGVPLIPVGSLEAMAMAAFAALARSVGRVVCVIDAKRKENFYAVYDRQLRAHRGPAHVAAADTRAVLGSLVDDETVRFCGQAARGLGLAPGRLVEEPACTLPHAEWVARRALALRAVTIPALAAVEPMYLRAPDAVPNLPKPLIGG
ncbi:MAG: tRNA (adenosine(37)-N6)-threonylcarbamoyltransferase complex dimerization subunit type 1 TsaB [Deltaproteobacteria bacterium]|nr:tRNA (adenosine(37)-N6)-threonylcarbamoyltransferase complex dimerization subunit type 1 TsaB [Deltaproteobacteria bacterium]